MSARFQLLDGLSFRPKRADAFSSRSLLSERVGSRSGGTVACSQRELRTM
jgi:hypothetical protein